MHDDDPGETPRSYYTSYEVLHPIPLKEVKKLDFCFLPFDDMNTSGKGFVSVTTPDSAQSALQIPVSESELKRAKNQTILLPQPSTDPRDPLVRFYP